MLLLLASALLPTPLDNETRRSTRRKLSRLSKIDTAADHVTADRTTPEGEDGRGLSRLWSLTGVCLVVRASTWTQSIATTEWHKSASLVPSLLASLSADAANPGSVRASALQAGSARVSRLRLLV